MAGETVRTHQLHPGDIIHVCHHEHPGDCLTGACECDVMVDAPAAEVAGKVIVGGAVWTEEGGASPTATVYTVLGPQEKVVRKRAAA